MRPHGDCFAVPDDLVEVPANPCSPTTTGPDRAADSSVPSGGVCENCLKPGRARARCRDLVPPHPKLVASIADAVAARVVVLVELVEDPPYLSCECGVGL